jgi:hypothetical protein
VGTIDYGIVKTEINKKTSICPSCQKQFECGTGTGENGCWCEDFPAILEPDSNKLCLCKDCLKANIQKRISEYVHDFRAGKIINDAPNLIGNKKTFIEGIDYYIENGRWVFKEWYLLKRGYCCRNKCRHCPYGYNDR